METNGNPYGMGTCPAGLKLGRYENNTIHSVGQYGFRIWTNYSPKKYACQSMGSFDEEWKKNGKSDPYDPNPY